MKYFRGKALILGAMAATASASASGATVVQNRTASFSPYENRTIYFNGFDSLLGTLTRVDLNLITQTTLNAFYNCTFCGMSQIQINYPITNQVFVGSNSTPISQSSHLFAFADKTITSGGETILLQSPLVSSSSILQLPTDLSYFSAFPSLIVKNNLQGGSWGGFAINANISLLQTVNATLTYTYEEPSIAAVPEPATWMLMLLGMTGVGYSMRRKDRQTLRVHNI